jgi:hypothetical protein
MLPAQYLAAECCFPCAGALSSSRSDTTASRERNSAVHWATAAGAHQLESPHVAQELRSGTTFTTCSVHSDRSQGRGEPARKTMSDVCLQGVRPARAITLELVGVTTAVATIAPRDAPVVSAAAETSLHMDTWVNSSPCVTRLRAL